MRYADEEQLEAGNPVWPLATDAVAAKTRATANCELRIMPEGMKKCTRFAPYGVEHHQAPGGGI